MRDSNGLTPVARVVGLWRYPVKSMAGEPVSEIDVSWNGFAGDRRWAFVREGISQSGIPWLTLRERAEMSHYFPSIVNPAMPDQSQVNVRTPAGVTYDITDAALTSELYPPGARVIKYNRGIFDTFPLSIITTQSIAALAASVGVRLGVERFRPNILLDAADGAPFIEDEWVGSMLQIGGMLMRVDKRDGRCAVITIDPLTTQRNPEILRAVARDRAGCVGIYGSMVKPGRLALHDPVYLPLKS